MKILDSLPSLSTMRANFKLPCEDCATVEKYRGKKSVPQWHCSNADRDLWALFAYQTLVISCMYAVRTARLETASDPY
jgi:hypothetical protein